MKSEFIFNLVKGLKLVDSYGIYQLWMNHINEFNEDVKLIQKYPDISKPETLKELLLEQLNVYSLTKKLSKSLHETRQFFHMNY
ncbi:hypothetical protein NWE60_06915 [Mycoplasmopsis felis]|nr:hypothetical protein [Mycoplasmopsis felis]WAM01073.1 hypothetical protein NWE60_06915 [Mycoplasmopsis felis]